MHIVPTPIRDCLQPELRAIDAVFRLYVRSDTSLETIVYDLDDHLTEVYHDEYPEDFLRGGEAYDFTLYTSNDVRTVTGSAGSYTSH